MYLRVIGKGKSTLGNIIRKRKRNHGFIKEMMRDDLVQW